MLSESARSIFDNGSHINDHMILLSEAVFLVARSTYSNQVVACQGAEVRMGKLCIGMSVGAYMLYYLPWGPAMFYVSYNIAYVRDLL